jgi:eukaryotic-like serine/threonine-protein kinase
MPGVKLGPYEIVSPLGSGGMGEVYRARDARLGRDVAVKILPAEFSADAARKQRFEREAKTVSSLNHPHICVLHDVGSQDGIDYLVMECLEGETLAKRLEKGPLPLEQVLKYGSQIADALDKAHHSGVVHRDLKPGNIILTSSGAKLLDFGLAKPAVSVASGATLTSVGLGSNPVTQEGTIVGTFQYMSPEQIEGKELDCRSDIFALGAVLYEAVTGQRAFEGKSQLSVASAILEKEPPPISTIKPLAPRSLEHVIRRCLAKDPDDRWQSARDLALELRALATLDPSSQSSAAALPVARRKHLRDFLPWVVATLALLVLSLVFLRPHNAVSALPVYSSIDAPQGTSFEIEGDMGAQPVLSPDGSSLVFGASGDLWLRSLRNGSEHILTGTHSAMNPFWSPDNSSIGFFAEGKLKTLQIATGVVRTICPAASPRGGTWGPTGVILFTPNPRDAIYQVPAAGGTPVAVTKIDTSIHSTHRWPVALPDGKRFLYFASSHITPLSEQNGIYIASFDGQLNRFLVPTPSGGGYADGKLLFAKESTLYAQTLDFSSLSLSGSPRPVAEGVVVDLGVWHATFTASDNGFLIFQRGSAMAQTRMEWVDRNGKHLDFVGDKDVFLGPRLSKDGHRLLVGLGDPTHDVWAFDAFGPDKTRLTFDGDVVAEPVWSPDSSRFAVVHGLPNRIFRAVVRPASGTGESTTFKEVGDNFAVTDWSPDGRYLVTETGIGEIELLPLNPQEQPRRIFSPSPSTGPASSGQFSPDGKFVTITIVLHSGPEVFIIPASGGTGMWQVSNGGGKWGRWSRDGKQLYYVSMRNEMVVVDIREKGDSIAVGHPTPLFTFHPSLRVYRQGMIGFDVSADGRKFLLVTAADENSRPLTLLQNWPALIAAK